MARAKKKRKSSRTAAAKKKGAKKKGAKKKGAKKRPKGSTGGKKAAAGRKRTPRVRLKKATLSTQEERKVNALIVRVYQKAAEEMRRVEEAASAAKKKLFADAARDLAATHDRLT